MLARAVVVLVALLTAVATPLTPTLSAQTQPSAASKQETARSQFRELTDRMQKLMVTLQQSEPETSSLLRSGLTYVQEKKLHDRLANASTLLQQERWDEALQSTTDLLKDLQTLHDLLQNRNVDLRKLMEEIAKLQAFRDRVDQLAKEQGEEKNDSARMEDLQKHLADLEAKKARAEALLAAQKELREKTNDLGMQAAAEATKPLADKEAELQEDTAKFAKDLEQTEKKDAELKADAKASDTKADPKDGKSNDPSDAEPTDPKDGKPAEPSDAKPADPKDGSQPPSGAASGKAGQASQSMGKAQKQLSDKKPESSLKDQEQAIESLKKTVEELEAMAENARREMLKLPFEQQAKKQEQTQHATDTLSKDMEKAEQGDENGETKPTPGKKRVQQAVPKQRAAAGQLKEYKPAKQKQQDAKDDLESAKKELDEALAQLRQQLSDEVLRALEERFTAMLAKQRDLSTETKTLDGTRQNVLTANGDLPAALVERILGVATGEGDLEVEASDALKLLEEDATTAVFPPMVEALREELQGVGTRCRNKETGAPVQAGQREVEDILELLINALRKEIERREGGGQCNCNGQPPLVPVSAELKVLRYLQERVNKQTKEFDGRPADQKSTDEGQTASATLSSKQGRVRDLMRRLAVKLGKENEAEEGR